MSSSITDAIISTTTNGDSANTDEDVVDVRTKRPLSEVVVDEVETENVAPAAVRRKVTDADDATPVANEKTRSDGADGSSAPPPHDAAETSGGRPTETTPPPPPLGEEPDDVAPKENDADDREARRSTTTTTTEEEEEDIETSLFGPTDPKSDAPTTEEGEVSEDPEQNKDDQDGEEGEIVTTSSRDEDSSVAELFQVGDDDDDDDKVKMENVATKESQSSNDDDDDDDGEVSALFEVGDEEEEEVKVERAVAPSDSHDDDNEDDDDDGVEDLFDPSKDNSDNATTTTTSTMPPDLEDSPTSTSTSPTTTNNNNNNNNNNNLVKDPASRLSKWAARLFDPDRPRGLVQAPEVIPLNDEVLQNFGRREKDYYGNVVRTPLDIVREVNDSDTEDTSLSSSSSPDTPSNGDAALKHPGFKIRVSNLNYATSLATLTNRLHEFGPTRNVNLIMDGRGTNSDAPLSIGKAYATFQHKEDADACVKALDGFLLEGRPLRLNLVKVDGGGGGGGDGARRKPVRETRYYATILRRDSSSSEGSSSVRPCPVCTSPFCPSSAPDPRACPVATTCFHCGTPGHVARDCRAPRARRLVCATCLADGHHRWHCRGTPREARADGVVCWTCGRPGHAGCEDMRWSHGIAGALFCHNCGERGHHGAECARPRGDACARNPEVGAKEIERAGLRTEANEIVQRELDRAMGGSSSSSSSRRRDHRDAQQQHRRRAKSQPPPAVGRYHERSRREEHEVRGGYRVEFHQPGADARTTYHAPYHARGQPPPPYYPPQTPPPPPPQQNQYSQYSSTYGRGYIR